MATLLETPPTVAANRGMLVELPILILNIHSHCNCRCLMCDIWKRETHSSVSAQDLDRHRESLRSLKVREVVLSGGEPLLNTDLANICSFFHELNIRITLLTTGLLLKKRAIEVAENVDEVIVSLDGPAAVHDAIRRVPGAFALIGEGVCAVKARRPSLRISARCTVQRANHPYLEGTARSARSMGLDALSFLAADVSSTAFNRAPVWPIERQSEVALTSSEADALDEEVERLIAYRIAECDGGFIVENAAKLRRIASTFRVYLGQAAAVSPKCNAPWVSTVIEIDGAVRPCFFQPPIGSVDGQDLQAVLQGPAATSFRERLDVASNSICQRCVCSLNYSR